MKLWHAAVLGGAVMLSLNQAENESPGATGRAAANARAAVSPLAAEAAGALGDAVSVVRDEASKQGVNPTGVFTQPTVDARDFESIPQGGAVPGMNGG